MGLPIEFHAEAQSELEEALIYYESHEPGLGEQFMAETRRVLLLVSEHPEIGQEIWATRRRLLLTRFPYAVVYRIKSDRAIQVLAVMHLRKRPGYWHERK